MVKKTSGRIAVRNIMQMLVDDEHIEEDFMHFIDNCLSDYLFHKKLDHSINSAIRFNEHWFTEKALEGIKEQCSLNLKTTEARNND